MPAALHGSILESEQPAQQSRGVVPRHALELETQVRELGTFEGLLDHGGWIAVRPHSRRRHDLHDEELTGATRAEGPARPR